MTAANDIKEQLRAFEEDYRMGPVDICLEAADRIEQLERDTAALQARVAELEAQCQHWKANHDNQVAKAALLTQRTDLPVDRLPAYRELERLQAMVAAQAQEPAFLNVPLPERVIDTLWQAAGISTYHPDGDQQEKMYAFAIGVKDEVLARLPRLYTTPPAPASLSLVSAALEAAAKACETSEVLIPIEEWKTKASVSAATAIGLAAAIRAIDPQQIINEVSK